MPNNGKSLTSTYKHVYEVPSEGNRYDFNKRYIFISKHKLNMSIRGEGHVQINFFAKDFANARNNIANTRYSYFKVVSNKKDNKEIDAAAIKAAVKAESGEERKTIPTSQIFFIQQSTQYELNGPKQVYVYVCVNFEKDKAILCQKTTAGEMKADVIGINMNYFKFMELGDIILLEDEPTQTGVETADF